MNVILTCIILISFSFIFASSEIAIFSLSRVQLKKIKDQSEPLFQRIRILIHDSFGLLITVLFFNEIVNISLAALITSNYIEPLSLSWQMQTLLGIMITTPIMLIFCELTPKVVATRANQLIISLFLPIVYFFYIITKPLASVVKIFFPKQPLKELHNLHEDDFIIIAEEQTETGHLHETELELIKNIFQMDDTRVEQIATPLRRIITVPSTCTLEMASKQILKDKVYSRIPVHGKSKEDIVGVLNTKDLVTIRINPEMNSESVMSIAKEPLVIAGSLSLETLFKKMKSKKVQVAFTKNNQGKITGMITMQDILDAVIEEAFEE
jgi:CBS domain containing-hemolysin-like protein